MNAVDRVPEDAYSGNPMLSVVIVENWDEVESRQWYGYLDCIVYAGKGIRLC